MGASVLVTGLLSTVAHSLVIACRFTMRKKFYIALVVVLVFCSIPFISAPFAWIPNIVVLVLLIINRKQDEIFAPKSDQVDFDEKVIKINKTLKTKAQFTLQNRTLFIIGLVFNGVALLATLVFLLILLASTYKPNLREDYLNETALFTIFAIYALLEIMMVIMFSLILGEKLVISKNSYLFFMVVLVISSIPFVSSAIAVVPNLIITIFLVIQQKQEKDVVHNFKTKNQQVNQ